MSLAQRRQAMLQLLLSDQQFHCPKGAPYISDFTVYGYRRSYTPNSNDHRTHFTSYILLKIDTFKGQFVLPQRDNRSPDCYEFLYMLWQENCWFH